MVRTVNRNTNQVLVNKMRLLQSLIQEHAFDVKTIIRLVGDTPESGIPSGFFVRVTNSAGSVVADADTKIVEGPAMIKSENGRLLNYVTLNVRGRDIVGFVDGAQRVVAQKVNMPEGVHIEWSGEFEHQLRAARTLRFVPGSERVDLYHPLHDL